MGEQLDPASVLEEAADWLLIHGRSRWSLSTSDGAGCVMHAICSLPTGYVAIGEAQVVPAWEALSQHLGCSPVTWNERTDDDFEVIDTLRRVAKDLRNAASC